MLYQRPIFSINLQYLKNQSLYFVPSFEFAATDFPQQKSAPLERLG
jgi:hypothetical protein